MHAATTERLGVVVRVGRTDRHATHRRVVRKSIYRSSWALHHALTGRVVAVGIVAHGTHLHAQPRYDVGEVSHGAAREVEGAVGKSVDALLGERVAETAVDLRTDRHADEGVRVAVEDRVRAALGHAEVQQTVSELTPGAGSHTAPR